MIPAADLFLFFTLVFGIVILPGLDMAFILGNALVGGKQLGFAAILGIIAGGMCHVAIGGLGIGAVLQLFPAAFSALLFVGAAYMAWIGISLYGSGASLGAVEGEFAPSWMATFRRGALTNLLNPKAYAFMLAIFPQFVRPAYGPIAGQALELGTIITATQLSVYGAIVMAANRARRWLESHPRVQRNLAKGIGVLLVVGSVWSVVEGIRRLLRG